MKNASIRKKTGPVKQEFGAKVSEMEAETEEAKLDDCKSPVETETSVSVSTGDLHPSPPKEKGANKYEQRTRKNKDESHTDPFPPKEGKEKDVCNYRELKHIEKGITDILKRLDQLTASRLPAIDSSGSIFLQSTLLPVQHLCLMDSILGEIE